MKYLLFFTIFIFSFSLCKSQTTSSKTFLLRSGEVVNPSIISNRYPLRLNPYFIFDNSKQIKFDDIVYYEENEDRFAILGVKGNGSISTIRRIEIGNRIDIYEKLENTYEPYPQKATYQRSKKYFLKDQEVPLVLNYSNLRVALADNKSSLEILSKAGKTMMIEYAAIGAGLGLAVYLSVQSINSFSKPSQAFLLVPLTLIIPLGTKGKKERYYQEAVDIYNN